MLQLNPPTPQAWDISNFRAPTKKYQKYLNFWVNNVNGHTYLAKYRNKQICN